MPTYEYKCERCESTFEAEQKMTDAPLTKCPVPTSPSGSVGKQIVRCGGPVKRLISGATTFVLKGPGWFKDGY